MLPYICNQSIKHLLHLSSKLCTIHPLAEELQSVNLPMNCHLHSAHLNSAGVVQGQQMHSYVAEREFHFAITEFEVWSSASTSKSNWSISLGASVSTFEKSLDHWKICDSSSPLHLKSRQLIEQMPREFCHDDPGWHEIVIIIVMERKYQYK